MQRNFNRIFVTLFLCCLASLLSMGAMAQKGGGGGGGGGNSRTGGTYNIIWDAAQPINGVTPTAVGSINISTYITTVNLTVKLSSVNLPDNTPLTVTVYANDYYTGLPWLAQDAGTLTLIRQKGLLSVPALWVTAVGFLPIVTKVVVTQADGTLVMAGHP